MSFNSTNKEDGHSDDSLPIIIGVCVSVGAVLVICVLAVTILLYRRKKRAMVKKASFRQRPDPGKFETTETYDAGIKPESPRIIEPYSVITLNEYTTTEGITTPKKFTVEADGNKNINNGITLKTFSEPGFQCGAHESNELRNSEAMQEPDTNLDDTNTGDQVNVDSLQQKRQPTLSELYPDDSIPQGTAPKEHIYFELEPEFVTPQNRENLTHQ